LSNNVEYLRISSFGFITVCHNVSEMITVISLQNSVQVPNVRRLHNLILWK